MQPNEIINFVQELYQKNNFMQYCGIHILEISCGKASVGLKLNAEQHTNLNGKLHGGLLMTLMDNATGIAGASIGKRVITVSMTINFIKGAEPGTLVAATATIEHVENNFVNMHIEVYEKNTGTVLATGSSCMLSIADFPGIPEKW